jgi:glycosyltransferase involved in cell wall biosynthesis
MLTRVCYVIPSLQVGGTERQLIVLMKGLISDHELTVICTHTAGALIGEARRLGAYVRELDGGGGWDFTMRHRIRSAFRAHRPDVVHTFMFGFDLAASRAAHETGVPVVISSRRELATWKKPRHIRLQKKANELADCVVANSHAVAQFAAQQEGADPSLYRVIPNGVDADAFASPADLHQIRMRFKIPFHTHVVGIVANFSPVKDHKLFLAIAEELTRRRADIHFLLVGGGPLRDRIMDEVQRRDWDDLFTRVAAIEEIGDLYKIMSVSVLCSKVEGFPNAVIESMAAWRPVVAAATGGIPEIVDDGVTGKLVHTREPADFADAIEWVLDRPDESAAMATRAGEWVRSTLTVDRMVSAYRNLYREMLVRSTQQGA